MGLSTELSSHGALGFAVVSAGTLGEVLNLLPRLSALRLNLVSFLLDNAADPASLVLQERLPDPDLRSYVLGHVTGAVLRLLQSVTGQPALAGLVLDWPIPEGPQATALRGAVRCRNCKPQQPVGA